MALDPTLRDKLAQTIHDAACRCGGPIHHRHYLAAADKAAELLTASPPYRFPDGWERGHEAKYWAQTGLTPYGLTLDPERAPGVLNWLGVNYYTPDSPHLPASAAAPIVLPAVEDVAQRLLQYAVDIGDCSPDLTWSNADREMQHLFREEARAALDLIASRVHHWVPVEPGTVIKAGTRLREDWDDQITEWTLGEDQDPYQNCGHQHRYYIDPATVPAEPEDPRVEVLAEEMEAECPHCDDEWPCAGAERFRGAARRAIARLDALDADR